MVCGVKVTGYSGVRGDGVRGGGVQGGKWLQLAGVVWLSVVGEGNFIILEWSFLELPLVA